MQTRAAVVEGQGQPFTMTEVELDEPREDEVLVRMVATGLCHTDITMGTLPAGGDVPQRLRPRGRRRRRGGRRRRAAGSSPATTS